MRHLHGLASRWPLSFDGFDEMHEAAGADASFTPRYTERRTPTKPPNKSMVSGRRFKRRTGVASWRNELRSGVAGEEEESE